MVKIAIVVGTRPEIIKCSPIIRLCAKRGIDYFVVHTGQHYSYEMDKIFFEQLRLPQPKYNLNIKSSAPFMQGEHTGKMLIEMEKIFLDEMPDIVLVQGDTNTVLAGALAAKKISTTRQFTGINIKLGHVEACLRSYSDEMPEEVNRKIADHISDYLYAPTEQSLENARKENIDMKKVVFVGNTIVDAVNEMKDIANSGIAEKLGISRGRYILATAHRQENVDSEERFRNIVSGLDATSKDLGMPVIYPIHPRSQKLIEKFGIEVPKSIRMLQPLGYLEFLELQKDAFLVLTDSGGVQEESCILQVPCVTLRDNTERPETLEAGSNMLAGTDPAKIVECSKKMISKPRSWKNPFGDGRAAERIVDHILKNA